MIKIFVYGVLIFLTIIGILGAIIDIKKSTLRKRKMYAYTATIIVIIYLLLWRITYEQY